MQGVETKLKLESVTVKRRLSDWMAFLNGHRGKWGCASTIEAAIGNALRAHASDLVAEVEIFVTDAMLRMEKWNRRGETDQAIGLAFFAWRGLPSVRVAVSNPQGHFL